ncbi:MAG: tripartite tricarboxylate transporter TctB family protein [Candidatus Methylomirabilales bacterium]
MANLTMKKADIIAAVIVIPICLYVFYESAKWPVPALLGRPFVIPRGVATFLLVTALLLLYRALKGRALELEKRLEGADLWRVIGAAVITFGYLPLVERIGFVSTTFLYMLLFALVLGERRWPRLALFAILVPLVVYVLFSTALHVPLPQGWIESTLREHGFALFFR